MPIDDPMEEARAIEDVSEVSAADDESAIEDVSPSSIGNDSMV